MKWKLIAILFMCAGTIGAQVPLSGSNCVTATAQANAYGCFTSTIFTPLNGTSIDFRVDVANTGASTLNVNGTGAYPLKKQQGTVELGSGDLVAGSWNSVTFDGAVWQLRSQTATGGAGTVTTSGSPGTNTLSMFSGPTSIGSSPLSTDGTTLSSTQPIAAPGLSTGSSSACSSGPCSSALQMSGKTSGGVVLVAADVAGAQVGLIMPTNSSTASSNYLLSIGASTSCPTTDPAGPTFSTCYPLSWAAPGGTSGCMAALTSSTSGSATTLAVSGIPSTCHTLTFDLSVRSQVSAATDFIQCRLNGDTATANYIGTAYRLTDTAINDSSIVAMVAGATIGVANIFTPMEFSIPAYTSTTIGKSYTGKASYLTGAEILYGYWTGVAAVTSISCSLATGPFVNLSSLTVTGR